MVPMIAPDGTPGDIPYESMKDAQGKGFKPAVIMKSKEGKLGYIPADRVQEASKGGLQIVPFEQQEIQHPGVWRAIFSDIASIPGGMARGAALLAPPAMVPGMTPQYSDEQKQLLPQTVAQDQLRKTEGHGLPYRAGAQIAGIATNVPGMEQSAREGDVGGVYGHAASGPIVTAATMLGAKVMPRIARAVAPDPARLYESALKPSTTLPLAKRAAIVETGLKNEIPVSAAGAEKIAGLIDDLNSKIKDTIDTGQRQGVTINKFDVASRLKDTANKFRTQVNPTADMQAITESGKEFLKTQARDIQASDAQALKQGTYRQLKGKAYGELKGASIEAQKALARGIKEELASAFPELKGLNQAESKLFDLQSQIERAISRQGNHQLMGIGTPAVTGAAKMATGSNALAATAGAIKAIVDNPIVKSRIAIALNRRGVPMASANARIAAYSTALASASQPSDDQKNPQ